MEIVYWSVGGMLMMMYFVAPLIIRSTLRINARPTIIPLSVQSMPPEVFEYFGQTAPDFERLGFRILAYYHIPDHVPNTSLFGALWQNDHIGQAALAAVIFTKGGGGQTTAKKYSEFMTLLADGRSVLTNNSPDLGAFKPVAEKDVLSVRAVSDIATLFGLHCDRDRRLLPSDAPRFVAAPGDEQRCFALGLWNEIHRQSQGGYLEATNEPDIYHPSLAGAYVMTWRELPPIKQVRRMLNDSAANAQLRHLQAPLALPARKTTTRHPRDLAVPAAA